MNLNNTSNTIRESALNSFRNFGYGLFIHYSVYSVAGRGEWLMPHECMTPEEYFSALNQPLKSPTTGLQLPLKLNADTLRILKLVIEGEPFGIPNNMWPKDNFRVC